MPKPTNEELENRFLYHASKYPSVVEAHKQISQSCLALAQVLCRYVPEGRGLSIALTELESVRMRANMGIACDQDALERDDAAITGRTPDYYKEREIDSEVPA